MRVLLINPNTSTHITERLAASARQVLHPGDSLHALTAPNGPAAVRSREGLEAAELSTLDMAAAHAGHHDVLVLGISLDSMAPTLRERYPSMPVVGMTEAALFSASLCAERLGLLTLGAALLPLYQDRVAQIGLSARVLAYEAPEAPDAYHAEALQVDETLVELLVVACMRMKSMNVKAIVLAGAVLCGYAEVLSKRVQIPVFDGITCAIGQARILHDLRSSMTPK